MTRRLRRQSAAFTTTHRLFAVAAAVGAALLFAPACALAAGGGASGHGHSALLSMGSIFSITDDLASIARHIFGAFVKALMPSSLTRDGIKLLTWLAALPSDPLGQTYKGVGQLESDMRDVAVAFIPLTLSLSAARYTLSGLTGGSHHPIESVVRVVGASFCLIAWPWFFDNVTALINIMTSTIFGFADVHHGLTVLWATMFGGGAAFGDFAGFAEILIIGAIALVVALIILKVAILVLLAFLFVLGPLAMMLSPVPELAEITKLFGAIFTAAAIIPIGWAMMFALGGAFIGSATQMPLSFSGLQNGFLALCAGLLCLFATLKWPTFIIGHAKTRLGGVAHRIGRAQGAAHGGSVRGGVAALPTRVAAARSLLECGGRTVARSLGAMGGAMGLPRGGLVGASGRLPGRALNACRQAGVAKEIKAGASASPAQAWEAIYDHTRRNATFTRPRPGAALKRGAAVVAATPTAVAASMGSSKAQARVTCDPAASAASASGGSASGRRHAGGGPQPRRADVRFGTAHLDNARTHAELRSPSVRHELAADDARRSAPRVPGSPAAPSSPGPSRASGSPGAGNAGSPRPQRGAGREDFPPSTPPSPAPRGTRGVKGGIQRVRAATSRSTGAQKPLAAPARTKTPAAAPSPREGAVPARSSRPAAAASPAQASTAPVPTSPAPSRPDPRSDQ